MINCEQCGVLTKNKRFCSVKCTSHWNNSHITEERNKKIGLANRQGLKNPMSLYDVSNRTKVKILKRLNIGCSLCGWNEGACDLHHIIPKSKGGQDSHDNVTLICPNCHRLAHSGKITKFVSLQEQIGEAWRKHYYAHE